AAAGGGLLGRAEADAEVARPPRVHHHAHVLEALAVDVGHEADDGPVVVAGLGRAHRRESRGAAGAAASARRAASAAAARRRGGARRGAKARREAAGWARAPAEGG